MEINIEILVEVLKARGDGLVDECSWREVMAAQCRIYKTHIY